MLHVYTKSYPLNENEIISNMPEWFDAHIALSAVHSEGEGYIKAIDNAVVLDFNTEKLETPFGVADKSDLSSGVKTVLGVIYLTNIGDTRVVDTISCGVNALDCIFDFAEKSGKDVRVLVRDPDVGGCKERPFILNNSSRESYTFDEVARTILKEGVNIVNFDL